MFGALGKVHYANYSVIFGAVCFLLSLSLVYCFGRVSAETVAYSVLLAEACVLSVRLFFCYKVVGRQN